MRALITNDDGVDSEGIAVLARAVEAAGFDVTVAAPSWDSSGASASLTAVQDEGRLVVERREWAGFNGQVLAAEAAPAFIVRAALANAFGPPPDVVVSGINSGPNSGHAVLHSGTVGAALTASIGGRPALAVSIGVGSPTHWDTAARVATEVLEWLVHRDTVVNVNVPNVAWSDVRGIVRARLASVGAVQATTTESGRGFVRLAYEPIRADAEPGTDVALLEAGYATVTPLNAVCEATDVDTTALEFLAGHEPRPSAARR